MVGKEDYNAISFKRKSTTELLNGKNRNLFTIIADHQPVEIKNNIEAGADLQVSGHTHAFQVYPLGQIMNLLNKFSYGKYSFKNFNLILTSGFAGWGFPLRTEKYCEYVIVNLIKQN